MYFNLNFLLNNNKIYSLRPTRFYTFTIGTHFNALMKYRSITYFKNFLFLNKFLLVKLLFKKNSKNKL